MSTSPLEPHITCKCLPIKYPTRAPYPQCRSKHASCVHENYVYLYAGKDGNLSLKDFWRLNTSTQRWEVVSFRGDTLHHLEGHTLVSCRKLLLMFGGEFGDALTESSLWIINPDLGYIRKSSPDTGSDRPCVRRYHSAVVYGGAMYLYGGYIDMKGSNSELWKYHIDDEEWELLLPRQQSRDQPSGRHGHSMVVYNKHIWLYGGSNDLVAKQDLWAYSFGLNRWSRVKFKYGPPALFGHTATVIGCRMFVFGGESNREPINQLWYFCFRTEKWSQIILQDQIPARMFHSALFITPSSQDNAVKASSMPYLQKKIAKMQLERPRSSPGQRPPSSGSHRGLHSSDYQKSLQNDKSACFQASQKQSETNEGYSQRPNFLSINNTGSEESLKVFPSPAENVADKSPLCPKKMDINYNALDTLNQNAVQYGIDNPGISASTEELVRENLHKRYPERYEMMDYTDGRTFNRSVSCSETENCRHRQIAQTFGSDSVNMKFDTFLASELEFNHFNPKKSRLDPELVLEDIEQVDCFPQDVQIPYPKYGKFNTAFSTESLVLDSDTIETIVLNDVRPRTRSKSACSLLENNNIGQQGYEHDAGHTFETVHFNKGRECVYLRAKSENQLLEAARNMANNQKSGYMSNQGRVLESEQREVIRDSNEQREVTHDCKETSFYKGNNQSVSSPGERVYKKNLTSSNAKTPKSNKPADQPYILVIGGKDNTTVNFSIKPIPMWKLQTFPL